MGELIFFSPTLKITRTGIAHTSWILYKNSNFKICFFPLIIYILCIFYYNVIFFNIYFFCKYGYTFLHSSNASTNAITDHHKLPKSKIQENVPACRKTHNVTIITLLNFNFYILL